ncbi:hypothetical protein [Rheinheimera sp. 4Y26]|uniref:hypothetical protein n=1 Tax=Rheinheimera sp. 4Y26 TaxID=2977811 RepID=UPI0021B15790|nr:hypothetical protein [Rheinheimera sp. 4Y26]MCT6699809.1 hypothetical protein [Rheinheimera sp. 4Y26]
MKRITLLLAALFLFDVSANQSDGKIDAQQSYPQIINTVGSMPGWVMTKLNTQPLQFWLINADKKVLYVHEGKTVVPDEVLHKLQTAPSQLSSELRAEHTFAGIQKVSPEIAAQIEQSLKSPDSFVLLNVGFDPKVFQNPEDPNNPCPPCKVQVANLEQLMTKLQQKPITLIQVELRN